MQGFTSYIGYSEWRRKGGFKVAKNECMETLYDAILIVQEREGENLKSKGDYRSRQFYSNSRSLRKSVART